MIAFEWRLVESVEFFQEPGECKFPLGNWETCGFPDVLCAWLGNGWWEACEWHVEEFECCSLYWRNHQAHA